MFNAVIVDAIRTPLGRRNGKLKDWHPVDLMAETMNALVERTGIDPGIIDDVVMGCVMQTGEQSTNIGRNAVLAAGWPESVPGTTIDRQCGSSQQAAHFAAQGVMAGAYDVVVAAGVEVMTRVPMGASMADEPAIDAPYRQYCPGQTYRSWTRPLSLWRTTPTQPENNLREHTMGLRTTSSHYVPEQYRGLNKAAIHKMW